MTHTAARLLSCLAMLLVMGACGGEDPAGPDVTGMTLPQAKTALKKAGVTAQVHAKDAMFGVLVEENFVVCGVEPINEHSVRLEVAKHGC